MTPYTTSSGIKIGSAYQPPAFVEHDTHALRLQAALLEERQEDRRTALHGCLRAAIWLGAFALLEWLAGTPL